MEKDPTKRFLFISACLAVLTRSVLGQGKFAFNNILARTHVGSLDGPLADSNIWAESLAGLTPETLMPLGIAVQHDEGLVPRVTFTVPAIQPCEFAYVQMVAWDGSLWGTSLAQVPPDQLGRTEALHVFLGGAEAPHPEGCNIVPYAIFRQSAIVPAVPEPSVWAVTVLGAFGILLFHRRPK